MSKQIEDHVLRLYEPKKLMGSGAYGHVWRAIERKTKNPYALKKIFDAFQNSIDAQRTYRQLTLLAQLDHPHIVKLHKAIKSKNNRDLYLVFEIVEADLHSLVGQQILQDTHLRFISSQMLRALAYLHSAQLIHRDLKPSNVLINSDCRIKICDFGLARSLTCQENTEVILSEEVATRWYRSPQMLLGSRNYGKATDIWSVGCIIAQLMTGSPLFPGSSTLDQLQKIIQFTGIPSKESVDSLYSQCAQSLLNQLSVRKRSIKDYFHSCDLELLQLVIRMLDFNPSRRITVEQALNHPCLKQYKEQITCCTKFILPPVDDNIKLTVAQYRKLINQDIERMYPEQNATFHYKLARSSNSFTKLRQDDVKVQRRQRSLFQPHNKHTSSPLKLKQNTLFPKVTPQHVKPQILEDLRGKQSVKKLLKRKRSRPYFRK